MWNLFQHLSFHKLESDSGCPFIKSRSKTSITLIQSPEKSQFLKPWCDQLIFSTATSTIFLKS